MSRLVLIALAALMTLAAAPAGAAQSTDQSNPCAAADALDGLAMVNAPAEDKSAEEAQGLCARGRG